MRRTLIVATVYRSPYNGVIAVADGLLAVGVAELSPVLIVAISRQKVAWIGAFSCRSRSVAGVRLLCPSCRAVARAHRLVLKCLCRLDRSLKRSYSRRKHSEHA